MKTGVLRRVAGGGILSLCLSLALLAALPATETGTRWLATVADWAAGDGLSIGAVSGSLVQAVRVQRLEVNHRVFNLMASEVTLSWAPGKLFDGIVVVTSVEMDGVRIDLHEGPFGAEENAPLSGRVFAMPLEIVAQTVNLTDITVARGGGELVVASAQFAARLSAAEITVGGLSVSGPDWRLSADGTLVPAKPFELNLQASWQRQIEGDAQEGRLTITGNLQQAGFEVAMQAPFELSSSGKVVRTADAYRMEAAGAWRDFQLPLFKPPSVRSPEGDFKLGGALDDFTVELDLELVADTLPSTRLTLVGEGSVGARGALPFEFTAFWQALMPQDVALSGELDASGDMDGIVVSPKILSPFLFSAEAALALAGEPSFEAAAEWDGVFWPLAGTRAIASPGGRLDVHGTVSLMEVTLDAELDVPKWIRDGRMGAAMTIDRSAGAEVSGSFDWKADLVPGGHRLGGSGTLQGMLSGALHLTHELAAPFEVVTDGTIGLIDTGPTLHLEGEWRDLRWPLTEDSRYRSSVGSYTLVGPLDAMELQMDGALEIGGAPPARFEIAGTLDDTGLALDPLLIRALGGQATGRGRIAMRPAIGWEFEVDAHGLDPGRIWPQWGGTLKGNAVVEGGVVNDGAAHTMVQVRRLQGRLRDYPVAGRGVVELAGGRAHARGVSLRSGDNRLEIEGVYGHDTDMSFSLEAGDLSALIPGAEGRLTGEGKVAGALMSPRMTMRLTGRDLRYRDLYARLAEIEADLLPDPAASLVVLKVADAHAVGQHIGSMDLHAEGSPLEHTARATVRSSLADLELLLTGGMEGALWRGNLLDTTLITHGAGFWRLERSAGLSVDADRVRVENMCLESDGGGRACADFERTASARSSIDIAALPLSILTPWLPEQTTLTGELYAEGALSFAGGRLEGNLAAAVSPGELTVAGGTNGRLSLHHADTQARATVDETGARLEFDSVIGGDGRLRADAFLDGLHDDAALDGRLEVTLPRLDALAPFASGLDAVEGEAHVHARLGGTLGTPHARGAARIEVTSARVPGLGIALSDSRLEARVEDEERLTIDGVLASGDGHLTIEGSGLLEGWRMIPVKVIVKGESFEIMRLPEATVFVSPHITVNSAAESLEVTGQLLIPRASIAPREATEDAVKISGDEMLVNQAEDARHSDAGPWPELAGDLVVSLGDEVYFDGFGLTSRLAGELTVRQLPGGMPTAYGALDLRDGKFTSYGQRLDIERGRLIFSGSLDDPGLDIRAVRKSGDVTAGILIAGTVSQPSSQIFSEPALSEADALSHLLTGQPLWSADGREASLLSQAALGLGLQGSDLIGMQIQSALGLDELNIAGDTDDVSLILGKRLNSNFGLRYALGLFGQAGSLFLNYRFTDHLSIEVESGVRQGLDLLFGIERDHVFP